MKKRGLETALAAYYFSEERRGDLKKLGIIDEQIAAVEAILPVCAVLIQDDPKLVDTRDELDALTKALVCLARISGSRTKATREAFNRWQMAADARGHLMGREPEFFPNLDIPSLLEAARDAKRGLEGAPQRRPHSANPEPIRQIAEALVRGWSRGRGTQAYQMKSKSFQAVVQIAYETMGFDRDHLPERALRTHAKWQKLLAARRAAERSTI